MARYQSSGSFARTQMQSKPFKECNLQKNQLLLTRFLLDGKNYGQIFSRLTKTCGAFFMSRGNRPPTFEEKWAIAVKALKGLISDAETKRLLANPEISEAFAECIDETPLPQLQTLSCLRAFLFRLSRYPLTAISNAATRLNGDTLMSVRPELIEVQFDPPSVLLNRRLFSVET